MRSRKGFSWGWSLLFALGAAFMMIVPAALYLVAYAAAHHLDVRRPNEFIGQALIGQIISYVAVVIYCLGFLPALAKRTLGELGVRAPNLAQIGIGLAGAFAMGLAVGGTNAIVIALTHRHDTEAAIGVLRLLKTPFEKALFAAIAVAFAPIVEELLFRVALFNAFARYAPVAVAAVLSGLLFGVVHAAEAPASQLVTVGLPLAAGGLVLAYVYVLSKCYWSNVISHAIFNSFTVIAVFGFHVKV